VTQPETRAEAREQPLELVLGGHSSLGDALDFARRCEPGRLVLVHPDPGHDEAFLKALARQTSDEWTWRGGEGRPEMGREGDVFDLGPLDH
jgi:phosphoribosyl 1,2-cyclic phosphodiesterase